MQITKNKKAQEKKTINPVITMIIFIVALLVLLWILARIFIFNK